jgi:ferredoxin-NADP reductase
MELLSVQLRTIQYEAEGVHSFELRPIGTRELPAFTAGAHIDVHLAPGLVRSYSLCNSMCERHRYVIAVNLDRKSRGGSRMIHDTWRVGTMLSISPPRNNFPLYEQATHSVLIAGGIGITPLLSMVRRLQELRRGWTLHYCARRHQSAAFLDDLRALRAASEGGALHLHFDDQTGGQLLRIDRITAEASQGAHFYCCGPLPMLTAFEEATRTIAPECVHVEYFSAKEPPSTSGNFSVELKRSGLTVEVSTGKTILDALLEAGIDVPYSCMEGVCASCETRVLEGIPDHRDLVLSRAERDSNSVMMICCSGSKSRRLVLDR